MTPITRSLTIATLALGMPAAATAQDLRHAVAAADLVVVARATGVQPIGDDWLVHRLAIEETWKGDALPQLSVLEPTRIELHQRPQPGELRLYCLRDASAKAARAGLPAAGAPYFDMSGHGGSNPPIDAAGRAALRELVDGVVAAERGDDPRALADRVARLALRAPQPVRTEAVQLLTERASLLGALDMIQISDLSARAVGETDDVDYKIALMQLLAEWRVPDLVESMCLGADRIEDRRFWQALGRVAGHLHGDAAVDVLRPRIIAARGADARGRLVLALGATGTEPALQALLRMRAAGADDPWVDAALRAHGGRRALEAVEKKQR